MTPPPTHLHPQVPCGFLTRGPWVPTSSACPAQPRPSPSQPAGPPGISAQALSQALGPDSAQLLNEGPLPAFGFSPGQDRDREGALGNRYLRRGRWRVRPESLFSPGGGGRLGGRGWEQLPRLAALAAPAPRPRSPPLPWLSPPRSLIQFATWPRAALSSAPTPAAPVPEAGGSSPLALCLQLPDPAPGGED